MGNRKFRGNIAGRDRNIWGNVQIVTTTATGSISKEGILEVGQNLKKHSLTHPHTHTKT